MQYKLTEYSHGAGCGCKLSPGVLQRILGASGKAPHFSDLIVGSETSDDAAVVNLDGKTAIVSTTDFFMPIVDDANDFGAIAATNAISDIYAMGASPMMAIAILGWPIGQIPAGEAAKVIAGARTVCTKAGIPLAGGHSIDSPEPIFGLAVTGKVALNGIKKNSGAKEGDLLYLTKPIGTGMVTTAQKKKLAQPDDLLLAKQSMLKLNSLGADLSTLKYVTAMTDVTGFGLGGHLIELCESANLMAQINFQAIPTFDFVPRYLQLDCIPGGTHRNWETYGHKVKVSRPSAFKVLADPQTSGGLLICVDPSCQDAFELFLQSYQLNMTPMGSMTQSRNNYIVEVN